MTELLLKPTTPPAEIERLWTAQREDNTDARLRFALLLPKDWTKFEPYQASPDAQGLGLALLARYGDRASKGLLEVYSQKIVRELSSADWLEHFAREREYRIEKRHLTDSPAGMNVDALATKKGKSGAPFVYRLSTFKDGNRIYLLAGFAAPGDFDGFAEAFVIAANSFQLVAGATSWSAEPIRTAVLSRVRPVELKIPQMWRREVERDEGAALERVHFVNEGQEKRVLGRLTVAVGTAAGHADHAAFVTALTKGIGGAPRVPLGPLAAGPSGTTDAQAGEAAFANEAGKDRRTLRVLVGRQGGGWVGVALVMHHVTADPFPVDAINNRAFEIVMRSLAPVSPSTTTSTF